ncbi:MAG: HAD-IB family phosphatase [Deltaproteobacteria bacterium]|nr:HAD-IB family phosphatase [Deltaproteobacteria bacterium]
MSLRYPLVCFDLDGTLVDDTIYIWKTLHEGFATDPDARKRAHDDFASGRITYERWFAHDLALLAAAGATKPRIETLLDKLRPMRGAREVLASLRAAGHKIAIISGSLDIVIDRLFPDFAFDHVLVNRIRFARGGRIAGGEHTPYDLERKADGLKELCRREGLSAAQAAFVGDNVNDVWVARAAGLAIAFNCKSEELRKTCAVEVKGRDLRAVLRHLAG